MDHKKDLNALQKTTHFLPHKSSTMDHNIQKKGTTMDHNGGPTFLYSKQQINTKQAFCRGRFKAKGVMTSYENNSLLTRKNIKQASTSLNETLPDNNI